jgi:hypothetical protein
MYNYRDKTINAILYWVILSMPLVYFLANYFYKYIITYILGSYLTTDPITVSIVLTGFLSLSKPIGGLTFAIAFWKISRVRSYERKLKTYMIISGWGILLIFGADQAGVQTLGPYPPFGLATISVLIVASLLMLLGIYNSAALVSANNELRRSILKHAQESKLLGTIGHAEMEKEMQKTIRNIYQESDSFIKEQDERLELDREELEKYLDSVLREVNKENIRKKKI